VRFSPLSFHPWVDCCDAVKEMCRKHMATTITDWIERGGRTKAPGQQREVRKTWLSDEEWALVRDYAKTARSSISAYVRRRALQKRIRDVEVALGLDRVRRRIAPAIQVLGMKQEWGAAMEIRAALDELTALIERT
jgi:predicted protein tyrosine phosphatase